MLGHASGTTARLQQRSLPIRNVSKLMLLAVDRCFRRRLYLAALGKLLHNPVNLIRVIRSCRLTHHPAVSILLIQLSKTALGIALNASTPQNLLDVVLCFQDLRDLIAGSGNPSGASIVSGQGKRQAAKAVNLLAQIPGTGIEVLRRIIAVSTQIRCGAGHQLRQAIRTLTAAGFRVEAALLIDHRQEHIARQIILLRQPDSLGHPGVIGGQH